MFSIKTLIKIILLYFLHVFIYQTYWTIQTSICICISKSILSEILIDKNDILAFNVNNINFLFLQCKYIEQ
jgi:hypothetical protein